MNLRALRYFLSVCDRHNFTAAARDLNVSQPALSQQIRLLEEELGVRLFVRTSHHVTLTSAGALVAEHAQRLAEGVSRLHEAVDSFRGLRRGKLRIGVIQSFNALHLAPILSESLRLHPGVDVTVLESANSTIIEGVADGTLDLGVAFGPVEGTLLSTPLYKDRLMLACSARHPFADRDGIPVGALSGETIALLTSDFATRRALDRFFEENAISPKRIVELNTFSAIFNLVALDESLSISIVPGWPKALGGHSRYDGIRFLELDPTPPTRTIQLVLPPSQARSPAAAEFASLLSKRFRS